MGVAEPGKAKGVCLRKKEKWNEEQEKHRESRVVEPEIGPGDADLAGLRHASMFFGSRFDFKTTI